MITRLRRILVHNWPQKVGALLLAMFIWWFVTVSDTPQTLASVEVQIEVEGLAPNSVVTGLPETVIVTIQGPGLLVERAQRDNIVAILDLAGVTGAFETSVLVLIPQGVELMNVSPSEVIGTIEPLASRSVPVEAVVFGAQSTDVRLALTVVPDEVTVSGLAGTLEQVTRVIVPVRSAPGERAGTPFAANTAGLPVGGVSISPDSIQVTVIEQPVLIQREVRIALLPPDVPGFSVSARLDPATVMVTGPPSLVAGLEEVTATADLSDMPAEPGAHVVPVVPALPGGVSAAPLTATIRLIQAGLIE